MCSEEGFGGVAVNRRTFCYRLRPMPEAIAGKYYCSGKSLFLVLCFHKATYYLVAEPVSGRRPSLYRRCAECAREDASRLGIAMPKGGE